MAQEADQMPPLWFLAKSGFDQLEWTPVLTEQERADLEHWAGRLEPAAYVDWYQWAAEHHRYQIFHILRDPLVNDPREVPPHVETRAMRRRRAALEQEPDAVFRIRTQMEADLPRMAAEALEDAAWWEAWEQRHPAQMEEIRQRDARIQEERRREERRQRASAARATFRRRCERANEARARMRRIQAEERADALAMEQTGESSGSN